MTQVVNTPLSASLRESSENLDWNVSKLAHSNLCSYKSYGQPSIALVRICSRAIQSRAKSFFYYAILVYFI